jgi:hypothetical protein
LLVGHIPNSQGQKKEITEQGGYLTPGAKQLRHNQFSTSADFAEFHRGDIRTDGRTDRRTNIVSYRSTTSRLKIHLRKCYRVTKLVRNHLLSSKMMNRQTYGRMDIWTDERMDGQTEGRTDRRTDGRTGEWMDGQTDKRGMDGWPRRGTDGEGGTRGTGCEVNRKDMRGKICPFMVDF